MSVLRAKVTILPFASDRSRVFQCVGRDGWRRAEIYGGKRSSAIVQECLWHRLSFTSRLRVDLTTSCSVSAAARKSWFRLTSYAHLSAISVRCLSRNVRICRLSHCKVPKKPLSAFGFRLVVNYDGSHNLPTPTHVHTASMF